MDNKNENSRTRLSPANLELKLIHTSELFGEDREVLIEHKNENYRLRITSNGKLILTK